MIGGQTCIRKADVSILIIGLTSKALKVQHEFEYLQNAPTDEAGQQCQHRSTSQAWHQQTPFHGGLQGRSSFPFLRTFCPSFFSLQTPTPTLWNPILGLPFKSCIRRHQNHGMFDVALISANFLYLIGKMFMHFQT